MKAIGFGVCVCLSISFSKCCGYGLWHGADQDIKLSGSSLLLLRRALYPSVVSVTPDVVTDNIPSVNLKDILGSDEFIVADNINDYDNQEVIFRVPYTKQEKPPEIILVSNALAYSAQERAFINDTTPYQGSSDPVSSISFKGGDDITPELPGLIVLHSTSSESSELRPFKPEVFNWADHEEQTIMFHDGSGPKLKSIATKELYSEYGDVASIKLIWNNGPAFFQCLLRPDSPTTCLDEDDIVDLFIAFLMLAADENGMVSRYLMRNGEVRYVISRDGRNKHTLSYEQLRFLLAIYDEFQQAKIYPELFSQVPSQGWVAPETWQTEHRIIPFTTLRLLARLIGQERLKLSVNSDVGRQTPRTRTKNRIVQNNATTQKQEVVKEKVVTQVDGKNEIGEENLKSIFRTTAKYDAKKLASRKNKFKLEELEIDFDNYCECLRVIESDKAVFEKNLSYFVISAFSVAELLIPLSAARLFEERSKASDEMSLLECKVKEKVQSTFPKVCSFIDSLVQRYHRHLEIVASVMETGKTDSPILLRSPCYMTYLFINFRFNSILMGSGRYSEYDSHRLSLRANALSAHALMLKVLFQSSETLQLVFDEHEYIKGFSEAVFTKNIVEEENVVYSNAEAIKFFKEAITTEFVESWRALAGFSICCSLFLSDRQLENVLTAFFILLEHGEMVPPLQADDFLEEQSSTAGNRLLKLIINTPVLMDKLCKALSAVLQMEKNIIPDMASDKQPVSQQAGYLFTWLPVLKSINSHIQDDEKEKTSGLITEIERFEQTIQQVTEQQKAQALKYSGELVQQEENKKALLVNQERLQKQRKAIKQYYREKLHSKDGDNSDTAGLEVTAKLPLSIWEQFMDRVASLITNENYQEAINQLEIIIIGSTDSIEIFISRSELIFILAAYIDWLALPLRENHRQQRLFEQVVENIDMDLLEQTLSDNDFQGVSEALTLLQQHSINVFSRDDREKYYENVVSAFESPDQKLSTITQLYQQLITHVEVLEPVIVSAIAASQDCGRSSLKQVDIHMISRTGFVREGIQSVIHNIEWIKKRFVTINSTLLKVKLINQRLGIYGKNTAKPIEKSEETLLQEQCKKFAGELPAQHQILQSIKKYLPDSLGETGAGD